MTFAFLRIPGSALPDVICRQECGFAAAHARCLPLRDLARSYSDPTPVTGRSDAVERPDPVILPVNYSPCTTYGISPLADKAFDMSERLGSIAPAAGPEIDVTRYRHSSSLYLLLFWTWFFLVRGPLRRSVRLPSILGCIGNTGRRYVQRHSPRIAIHTASIKIAFLWPAR